MGVGILARDSSGLVMVASTMKMLSVGDSLQAHAMAVVEALQLLFDVGLQSIIIEIGNKELLCLLNVVGPCFAAIGNLVDDIKVLQSKFVSVKFSYVSKCCNKAANVLATEALSSTFAQVWLEDCPVCIISHVQFDSLQ
jgi:hypothetical protein